MDEVKEALYEGNTKFMWDGGTYESHKDADAKRAEYEKDDFEVRITEKGGKHYVYTRRVVTEIVLEGEAPV